MDSPWWGDPGRQARVLARLGQCLVEGLKIRARRTWTTTRSAAMIPRVTPRLAALAIAAFGLARPLSAQCPDGTPMPCRPVVVAVRLPPPAPTSVAVLPLENRSPDAADAYLAEGLTEEVGNHLTQLGRLQVKARGMVDAQFRRTPDPFDAARRLNVAWFVHGNVRHAGSQLLVNVELIRTASGEEVWASRFARRDADVFAVQAEVAESVAVVVGGRLSPVERAALVRRPTRDNEAYRLYVYGNALLKRRTPEDVRGALAAFTEAVRRDPGFAAAWAKGSEARTIQYSWGWRESIPGDSILLLARVASRRALELDSSSAEVWNALGAAAWVSGDLWTAHGACVRARRLDSLQAEIWHECGLIYDPYAPGLLDVAAGEPLFRRAIALDPDLRNTWRHLAGLRLYEGRLAEAEALFDTTLAIAPWIPAYQERAYARFLRGNGAGALADIGEAERMTGQPDSNSRAVFSIALGDSAAARGLLARLRARADSGDANYVALARLSAALDLYADALSALEHFRAELDPHEPLCAPATPCSTSLRTWRLLHDPILAPLRDDPRFIRLSEETRPRVPWLQR
jgi:TolB-like protein